MGWTPCIPWERKEIQTKQNRKETEEDNHEYGLLLSAWLIFMFMLNFVSIGHLAYLLFVGMSLIFSVNGELSSSSWKDILIYTPSLACEIFHRIGQIAVLHILHHPTHCKDVDLKMLCLAGKWVINTGLLKGQSSARDLSPSFKTLLGHSRKLFIALSYSHIASHSIKFKFSKQGCDHDTTVRYLQRTTLNPGCSQNWTNFNRAHILQCFCVA